MSNTIIPFDFDGHNVRVVQIDEEPWFVLADVCKVLGLTNPSMAAESIDPDALSTAEVIDAMGRSQSARVVDESGLYELIFKSRKTEAQAFKRWVSRGVLPTIRKTGSYGTTQPKELSRADLARMVLESEEEKKVIAAALESAAPAIAYHDRYIAEDADVMTVTNFAAGYGMSAQDMYALMDARGLLKKVPFERFSEKRGRTVAEHEWRFRAGKTHPRAKWFDLRPQHNAPRHMNGQVRQTIYIRSMWAPELAAFLGLTVPAQIEEKTA